MNTWKYYIETADEQEFEFDGFEPCILKAAQLIKNGADIMWIECIMFDKNGNAVEANLIRN